MAEDRMWDSGQLQETVITEYLFFNDQQRDSSCYPHLSTPPLYERCTSDVLGDEAEDASSLDESVSHCFNCGSALHVVSSCPTPHNIELIALSRQMYHFFKPSRHIEPMTISAAAEFKHRRRQWISSFEPGHVRGSLLREALGLHDDDESDPPWLKNMADWGYPSGWFSEVDPRERILQQIDDLFVETFDPREGDHSLVIVNDDAIEVLDIGAPHVYGRSQGINSVIRLDRAPHGVCRRWATYPPTHFSSDHLPVYNGMRLPPILPTTSSTFTSERHLLWERILHNAADSARIQRLVPQDISQHEPFPPSPTTLPPPLPPPSPPVGGSEVDDALRGAHQPPHMSSDGESDMEMSDSDS
ncbi:hypothetical protein BC827DRAFT_1264513 [Russula dissimulans]|nr:hypothetical protein BC827DRAFT_1264513 [Russula dissimulans]